MKLRKDLAKGIDSRGWKASSDDDSDSTEADTETPWSELYTSNIGSGSPDPTRAVIKPDNVSADVDMDNSEDTCMNDSMSFEDI